MIRPSSEVSVAGAAERAAPATAGLEGPGPPRCFLNATLLFRCMDILRIDRRRLADDEPLLFRELQAICALCRSKEECLQDLTSKSLDPCCDDWGFYCPNAAMLTLVGAAQNAGSAARQAELARVSGQSHLR